MHTKFRRIPETMALAICLAMLIGACVPVSATHLVQPGDTLWGISSFFGISIQEIKEVNNLKGDLILAGETLAISQTKRMTVTPEERVLLARAVYSEARGEPFQGQVAIAEVILNRVEDPAFPDTISAVIYQPWAFTAVHDGQFWLTPDEQAYEAVEAALAGAAPSGGAVFYYNPVTASNRWIHSRPICTTIGKHVFAL